MKIQKYLSHSPEETALVARSLLELIASGGIVLLEGDLGAGKTTFSQALLGALGVQGPYTSPTFGVIRQYDRQDDSPVFHIDAYRIDAQDMVELGWYEMITDQSNVMMIEWPERISTLIDGLADNRKVIRVHISHIAESKREITTSF